MNHEKILGIVSGRNRSVRAGLTRAALACAEPGYHAAVWWRNRSFDRRLRRPADLGRATLSVGNLTTGGTGKTPMVAALANRLLDAGRQPAVLLRGYKSANGGSDEAAELRALLGPAVPVQANPNRLAGALAVLELQPSVDCLVLDDGFQHRQAKRDLDIVLIDATTPFGFEHLLPRGLLREPPSSLSRADAVIVTRVDHADPQTIAHIDRRVERLSGQPPVAHTACRWTGLRLGRQTMIRPLTELADKTVVGVCGIGNPGQFSQMLHQVAGRVLGCQQYPDHYAYTMDEPGKIIAQARADGADAVVLTEKDWVKWAGLQDSRTQPLDGHASDAGADRLSASMNGEDIPVFRPVLDIDWLDGSNAIDTLLKSTR